jgi:hypothetical protein
MGLGNGTEGNEHICVICHAIEAVQAPERTIQHSPADRPAGSQVPQSSPRVA